MRRKLSIYLRDILQNMEDAEEFVQGMSREEFEADKKTMSHFHRRMRTVRWTRKTWTGN